MKSRRLWTAGIRLMVLLAHRMRLSGWLRDRRARTHPHFEGPARHAPPELGYEMLLERPRVRRAGDPARNMTPLARVEILLLAFLNTIFSGTVTSTAVCSRWMSWSARAAVDPCGSWRRFTRPT